MKKNGRSFTFLTNSAEETQAWAARFSRHLSKGDVVLLMGPLGAGKTTFVQGFVRGLHVKEEALSPTFILAQTYDGRIPVHHLDFYRVKENEILSYGVEDYLTGAGEIPKGIVLIEWAERFPALWPRERMEVRLYFSGPPDARQIKIGGIGDQFERIVKALETWKGKRKKGV